MNNTENPAANIPSGLEDTDRKFGKPVKDWAVLIGLPVLSTFFVYTIIEPSKLIAAGMFSIAALTSIAMIIAQPNHLGALEWVHNIKHHFRRQTTVEHISETAGMEREGRHINTTSRAWETIDRTQEDTNIKQVHPDLNAIERSDGSLIGAIEVTGTNMALSDNHEWQHKTSNLARFYNQTVDFPIQTYITTKPFPIDEHVEKFKGRLNDKDLKENPIMDELAKSYMDSVLQDTKVRGTNKRKYYMITQITRDEIYDDNTGEATVIQSLRELPVAGDIITNIIGKRSDLTEAEKQKRMGAELRKRLDKISTHGIAPLEGCKARPVSAADLTVLHREHWTNRDSRYDYEAERFLRTAPVVDADTGMSDTNGMDSVETPNFERDTDDSPDDADGTDDANDSPDE